MEQFSQFFCCRVDALVNDKVELTEEQQKQQVAQQSVASGKEKEKKKDPKKEVKQSVEMVTQPKSNSGIQSLCVMVDSALDSLPWEHLQVFNSIAAKSKDFSLYQLAKKY